MSGIKQGKDLKISGWREQIEDFNCVPQKPKGYSTGQEIAEAVGMDVSYVYTKLKKMRVAGKVEAIKVKSIRGKVIWAYKD